MVNSSLLKDLPTDTADSDTLVAIDINQDGVLGKAELQNIDVGLFNNNVNYSVGEQFSFSTGMTEWADSLSNEEINRLVLQTGETLVVERIEFRQKGGGSSANASVRVQDTTAATTVGSQTLGGTTKDSGSSGVANTVQVQISNTTGSPITASVTVVGRIEGA